MTPCLLKVARIIIITESGYVLEVKDDSINEKQFDVDDEMKMELAKRGDLRDA